MKYLSESNISYLLELIAAAIADGASSIIIDTATLQNLGVVKPDGTTITINNGTISAQPPSVSIATTSAVGIAKPDNDTLIIDNTGTLSLNESNFTETELNQIWAAAKAAVDNS